MGLDFTVSETIKQYVDKQGNNAFITTEIVDFGNAGHKMMDYGLGCHDNCTTKAYDAVQFLECLDSMREALRKINDTGVDKYNEKLDLEEAISELQRFIEQEHITEDSDRVFDIHIWY